jgi:hypothetical protein
MKISVCLIAKDEENYIFEWVAYYRLLGFDEIIIYDNRSGKKFRNILKKLHKNKIIKHVIWDKGLLQAPQISSYRHALHNCKSDWILFVDTDEFLVLHKNENVHDFIANYHSDSTIGAIAINWLMFGDSGQVDFSDAPVVERFTKCAENSFPANHHIKSFIRLNSFIEPVHMHCTATKGRIVFPSGRELQMSDKWGVATETEYEFAQINHYYTKSEGEYHEKMRRGQVACRDFHKAKYFYNLDIFHVNNRNDVVDVSIHKILPQLKEEIWFLKNL